MPPKIAENKDKSKATLKEQPKQKAKDVNEVVKAKDAVKSQSKDIGKDAASKETQAKQAGKDKGVGSKNVKQTKETKDTKDTKQAKSPIQQKQSKQKPKQSSNTLQKSPQAAKKVQKQPETPQQVPSTPENPPESVESPQSPQSPEPVIEDPKRRQAEMFKNYLQKTGIAMAFQVIFAEILDKKIEQKKVFSYTASRLRQIGADLDKIRGQGQGQNGG